jgi:3-oxoacyl-[acyl-carrier protein] reductase
MHPDGDAILDRVLKSTPLGRFITPADVAKVVAFLASEDAQAIVGQTLVVDGGWSHGT